MADTDRLMDFKTDILVNIPAFMSVLNKCETETENEASLCAIKRFVPKKQKKSSQPSRTVECAGLLSCLVTFI